MSTPVSAWYRSTVLGALVASVLVLCHDLWLAAAHPGSYLDADLLSYLVLYRDWRSGMPVPFGYTVPKVLPIALFGPLGSPHLALVLSQLVAAIGGALVFVLTERRFGLTVALLASAAYVLDPLRGVLTLRSGVDLYVGVALLGAIFVLWHRAPLWAGGLCLLAALGKPVAALCGAAILLVPGVALRYRLVGAALPLIALPATALLIRMLADPGAGIGGLSLPLPAQHELFVRVAQGQVLDVSTFVSLVIRDWLGRGLFARSWPLVVLGAALYLVGDRARHDRLPADRVRLLVLVPGLLCVGYLALSLAQPFVVFTRFFWPLAVAGSAFAAYAAVVLAASLPVSRTVRGALVGGLALVLAADLMDNRRLHEQVMLGPFETRIGLAERALGEIARDESCAGAAVVPLQFLPLAAWLAETKLKRGELCAAEDWAEGRGCPSPRCVLWMPDLPLTARARQAMSELAGEGYQVELEDSFGALVRATRS